VTEYRILYHWKVVGEDIPKLDPPTRKRIKAAIENKLSSRPEEFAKPLAYTKARLWSLRVGTWRVIFGLREEELWVLKIGHRREVYKGMDREVPE
jgi:mRNA-degrading endonuclease RelE of RelBE toxin-antitoxin system